MSENETISVLQLLIDSANNALGIASDFFNSISGIFPILLSLITAFFLAKFIFLPLIGGHVGSDRVNSKGVSRSKSGINKERKSSSTSAIVISSKSQK